MTRILGIPFTPPMVRAERAGRKTMTRRLKPTYREGDALYVREGLRRTLASDGLVGVSYVADGEMIRGRGWQWKPSALASRYMPRWAARTWLEMLSVRAEPLQAITDADILAEGVTAEPGETLREAWVRLWDHINTHAPWASNPTVYVNQFRRRDAPEEGI